MHFHSSPLPTLPIPSHAKSSYHSLEKIKYYYSIGQTRPSSSLQKIPAAATTSQTMWQMSLKFQISNKSNLSPRTTMTTTLKKMPERKCHHRPLVRRQCHQWLENQIKPYRNRRQIIKRQTKASLSASEKAAASTTTMMTIPTVLQVKILIYFLFPPSCSPGW